MRTPKTKPNNTFFRDSYKGGKTKRIKEMISKTETKFREVVTGMKGGNCDRGMWRVSEGQAPSIF